jgi:acetyl esterase/lipase
MIISCTKVVLFVVLVLFFLLAAGCSPRRGYEAALVLADISAGEKPSRWKKVTPAPVRKEVAFEIDGRQYLGDLYRSPEVSMAAILLVPGAAELGRDDPRLVAFAMTLARARFSVLVPEIPSLRELKVNPGNILEVRDAFSWLVSRPDLAPGGRAGMAALSYAAGPAILAALETEIRKRVKFILAVGGYYDLEQVLIFFTTGHFRKNGKWHYLEPNIYGKWVFVLHNADLLSDFEDPALLRAMARRKMNDLSADIDDLKARLGPEGRNVYTFISNLNPQEAPKLLGSLPERIRDDIAALNLADKDLSRLKARLLLIHGYDDNIIPYSESIALANAVPGKQVRLFLGKGLMHVDIEPGLISTWKFWRAIDALLAERQK